MNTQSENFSWNRLQPKPSESSGLASSGTGLAIGGFVPFSTVDFPGKLAAVVFCAGCPWRCPYCHNPHLRKRRAVTGMSWEDVRKQLEKRRGFLEAVVFSGGEPTGQKGLAKVLEEVRSMGFQTGLHTAGIFPERLRVLLPHLNWVGLDIKTFPDRRYDVVTGRNGSALRFRASLRLLRSAGIPFQLRTTVDPRWIGEGDLAQMQWWLVGQNLGPSLLQTARYPAPPPSVPLSVGESKTVLSNSDSL